ncbi:MAG TPA: TonB family protein [Candidatus Baltobacteraceae bacterium]|nr:TonB family protein [Verrucomicrobiae bacterium]HTX14065.1 TonB family protein [Candidatus Baltobacteraceae bacterium]
MFEDMVVSGVTSKKTNTRWTVFVSTAIQAVILGILILIPLIYTEALPKAMLTTFLVAPPPPPPPPPPPAAIVHVKPIVHLIQQNKLMAPTVIPKKVNIIKEEETPPDVGVGGGVVGGVGGSAGGVLGGIIGGAPGSNLPPPPKVTPSRIKVGGNVQSASLIRQVMPVYPPIARTAHISGTVVLHAIIAKDGSIEELQYVSGPPLLMRAAMDAVREWRYRPTLLNGEPVEVDTTISVVFTLGD